MGSTCLHHKDPRMALKSAISLGGDTDTTASMVGAVMGALHGVDWCESWAQSLENGEHGRDFALDLGERLVRLDLLPSPGDWRVRESTANPRSVVKVIMASAKKPISAVEAPDTINKAKKLKTSHMDDLDQADQSKRDD